MHTFPDYHRGALAIIPNENACVALQNQTIQVNTIHTCIKDGSELTICICLATWWWAQRGWDTAGSACCCDNISTHNSISNPKLGCTLNQTNSAMTFYGFLLPLHGTRLVLAVLVAALSLALWLADVKQHYHQGLRCGVAGAFVGAAHDS